MSIETPGFIKALDDLNGFDEVKRILESTEAAKDYKQVENLKKVTKGPLDKVMGPIGTAIDTYSTIKGGVEIHEGLTDDGTDAHDDIAIVDGIHDLVDGGSGLLGHVPGSFGAAAKAFNAGFTVGDMIAPYVYNDADHEGRQMIDVPENGEFHAETGNESVDSIIDGAHNIDDGNYGEAALDIAEGGVGVLSAMANPAGSVVADVVGDIGGGLYKWATDDDD
jgi:hypothetical protein